MRKKIVTFHKSNEKIKIKIKFYSCEPLKPGYHLNPIIKTGNSQATNRTLNFHD